MRAGAGRLLLCALISLSAVPLIETSAWAEDHCPDNPSGTYVFFQGSATTSDEKPRVEQLAPSASNQGRVCIKAFYTTTYDKQFAFRRATWMMETLVNKGVSKSALAIQLAADPPGTARSDDHLVQVIFGP